MEEREAMAVEFAVQVVKNNLVKLFHSWFKALQRNR
jgi:hypothetical protein